MANKDDVEGNFMKLLALVPEFFARVQGAKREARFSGIPLPNYFHKPYGPGWALVGDAGYNRDFITAQGINDAFRDAEVCANALHRMCRPAELTRLLDAPLVRDFGPRLTCHDAEDPDQIADLGVTAEHGYPVEVSRLVTDSDLTVYVNTNYIRGFTGGWKSVCIGLSTWRSIRVTHDPDGMSMSLQRNRMHAVLDEMGHHLEERLGRRIFKVDILRNLWLDRSIKLLALILVLLPVSFFFTETILRRSEGAFTKAFATVSTLWLGVGLAFLRERLDDRIEGREDFEKAVGAPILAVVPKIPGWRKRDQVMLPALNEPKSSVAEAFRTVRTNLQFITRDTRSKVLVVTSAAAGEGKTTTTGKLGNFAIAEVGVSANFTVKLTWKKPARPGTKSSD